MRKMRTLPLPRYVEAASISEGDTIRATWKTQDVEHSRTGRVARIYNLSGSRVKSFVTDAGQEIVAHDPYSPARIRFTLLAEAEPVSEPLFEMGATE